MSTRTLCTLVKLDVQRFYWFPFLKPSPTPSLVSDPRLNFSNPPRAETRKCSLYERLKLLCLRAQPQPSGTVPYMYCSITTPGALRRFLSSLEYGSCPLLAWNQRTQLSCHTMDLKRCSRHVASRSAYSSLKQHMFHGSVGQR